MQPLEGVVRNYDWGSTTQIPELLRVSPDGLPWAELWLGAHSSAPALVGDQRTPLDHHISADPVGALGESVAAEFGCLPFLMKVLSAESPLSIQAHPSISQAIAGYEREDAAGIAVDAPNRSFRDRNHKPELICALTPFDALCGFREPADTAELFASIGGEQLDPLREMIADAADSDLGDLLSWLLTLPGPDASQLADAVVTACQAEAEVSGRWSVELQMAVQLGDRYPGDIGIVTALLLNHVSLLPGQALFLDAGSLHAYLHGTGIEIMANSDNVLRGGLTPKHIDVASLLEVVSPVPTTPQVQSADDGSVLTRYQSPVREFSLSRIEIDHQLEIDAGPAILLCTDGSLRVGGHRLRRGDAVWLPANLGSVSASGRGTLFWAGVGADT